MKTLSQLYQEVGQKRINLGDALNHGTERQQHKAQKALDNALEELNLRLIQLGRGIISSKRPIQIIDA